MTVTNFELMDAFITRWQNAGGKERANYQMFFAEFCDFLIPPDSKEEQNAIS
jgi:hypothetical protein